MSKTVYLRFEPVQLLENFPGSLQDTIIFNGFDTGILRYYEVHGTSFPSDRDYLEFTISQMTFSPQTLQNGTVAREGGSETYPLWMTRTVPDNFVIPTAPAADLRVTMKSVTPTLVANDGRLDFKFDLINSGNLDANSSHVGFYLSTDAKIDKSDT